MNLSNENVRGCRQVALAGGLQTISALAVTCCKSVALSVGVGTVDGGKKKVFQQSVSGLIREAKPKSQQCGHDDMDLLIVVLGVLVNLVERDESNRSVEALWGVSGCHGRDSHRIRELVSFPYHLSSSSICHPCIERIAMPW